MSSPKTIANFNFEKDSSDLLGEFYRPMAELSLWSEKYREWQKVKVIVDTGADYTIMPRYVAVLLGLKLDQIAEFDTTGVGGTQKVSFVSEMKVKLGKKELTIPIGFFDSNKLPPLLGRHRMLESFLVEFNHNKKISFKS